MHELALCRTFIADHCEDAARALERLPGMEAAALLGAMPAAVAAKALAAMVPTLAAECLGRLSPGSAGAMLVEMPAGSAAALLRRLDKADASAIIGQMPEDEVRLLSTMLDYPPDSAGSLMESRVFAASESLRVGDALAALRKRPPQVLDYVYVVDEAHRLVGVVGLGELLSSRRDAHLASIMNRAVSRLPARARRTAVLTHPGWRQFHALPVVDDNAVLVGAIAHATVQALLEEDALGAPSRADTVTTVVALGELYWLGLSGVLDGVVSSVRRLGSTEVEVREVGHGR